MSLFAIFQIDFSSNRLCDLAAAACTGSDSNECLTSCKASMQVTSQERKPLDARSCADTSTQPSETECIVQRPTCMATSDRRAKASLLGSSRSVFMSFSADVSLLRTCAAHLLLSHLLPLEVLSMFYTHHDHSWDPIYRTSPGNPREDLLRKVQSGRLVRSYTDEACTAGVSHAHTREARDCSCRAVARSLDRPWSYCASAACCRCSSFSASAPSACCISARDFALTSAEANVACRHAWHGTSQLVHLMQC